MHPLGERRPPGDTGRDLFLIRVFRVLRGNLHRRFQAYLFHAVGNNPRTRSLLELLHRLLDHLSQRLEPESQTHRNIKRTHQPKQTNTMKLISRSSRQLSAWMTVTALAIAVFTLGVGTSHAQRIRPPRPIPTVPPPVGVQVLSVSATTATATETPDGGYVLAVRYISGPVQPFELVFPIGVTSGRTVSISGLVPNSDYVFEMRRVSIRGRLVNSGFTRFSFRTASLAASAPSAPVIQVGAVTPTYVDIVWETPADDNTRADQFQYTYIVVGDPQFTEIPTCSQYCFGTTVLRLPRSASGARIVVRAYDSDHLASLPSNELIVP